MSHPEHVSSVWQPPAHLPTISGPVSSNAVFFQPPPPDMGTLLYAESTLTPDRPRPSFWQRLLCTAADTCTYVGTRGMIRFQTCDAGVTTVLPPTDKFRQFSLIPTGWAPVNRLQQEAVGALASWAGARGG